MKKNKFYFKQIVGVLFLSVILTGCSSDDSGDSETIEKRTVITMQPPANGEVNWNDVKMVWNEEFSDPSKLNDIWTFETNNNSNPGTDGLQVYREENVVIRGGLLKIYATEKEGIYTSARISSKYAFKYGRIEISAKLPKNETKGIWAKIGLLGDNLDTVGWPGSGEIDIMEYFTNSPKEIYNLIHSTTNNYLNGTLITSNSILDTAEDEFHAYGILWTDKYIKFYIDSPDNITFSFNRPTSATTENWPFDQPFFLLLHMVLGGQYGGDGIDPSTFPAIMDIDYIRVYHPQ